MADVKNMATYAVATVTLAAVTLVGIAVLEQFKAAALFGYSNCTATPTSDPCIFNDSADDFIAGLRIFGSFMAVIVIALVGKIVIGLFK